MKEKQFTDVSEEKVTQFFIDFIRNNQPKPKKEKHYEPQPADLTDFL
jgi:hypothetical protein